MKVQMAVIFVGLFLVAFAVVPFAYAINYDEIVSYWDFEEVTGGTVQDTTDNSNNGVVNGYPALTTGYIGNALTFHGGKVITGYSADVTPQMTSGTTPSPYRVLYSHMGSATNANQPYKTFDNSTTYGWWPIYDGKPAYADVWLTMDLGSPNQAAVESYKIYSSTGSGGLKNWRLLGSNDNASWTTLDTRTNYSASSWANWQQFNFTNDNAYRYYRLKVDAVQDPNSVPYVAEMEFMRAVSYGSNDYVGINDNNSLSTFNNGLTVTLSLKTGSFDGVPISRWGAHNGYGLYKDGKWYMGTGSEWTSIQSGVLSDDEFHVYVLTWDGSDMKSYRDGIFIDSYQLTGATFDSPINGMLSIGKDNRGTEYFDGQIDDVGIWSRALDVYEIGAIYDIGVGSFENLYGGLYNLTLDMSTEEMSLLARLYADGKAGLDPDALTVDGRTWAYLSGDLPGDFGGTTYELGDSWIYEGKYYIKLGSGLEGSAVPEPGCAFGLLVGFFVPGFRRLFKRRVRG